MLHPLIEIHYIAPVKLNKFLLPDFEIQPFPVTADCLLYTYAKASLQSGFRKES